MKITSTKLKNGRVQVFIDEKYEFSSSQNFIIEYQLFIGKEINEDELLELKKLAGKNILKLKLNEYATKANYSKKELITKLNRYSQKRFNIDIPKEDFDKNIKDLENSRIYNEQSALRNLISLYKNRGKGKNFISFKLMQKGFVKEDIKTQLSEIDDKAFNEDLKRFLEKKKDVLSKKAKDKYDLQNKLIKAAMSRGYNYSQIKELLSDIL